MMVFKKGDYVAFLNESLHGVVKDYIDTFQVLVECKGIEMAVSADELVRISHIPKVDGKHLFPVKKENKNIDDLPNLKKNAKHYNKLEVGDLVNFMSENLKGKVVSILSDDNYDIEIEPGFTIPANRLEIEKILVTDIEVDDKKLKYQLKKNINRDSKLISKSNQPSPKYFHSHEIDLHIENLVTPWRGLSNFEIVSIQLSCFRKRFDEALINNEPFLVVIHGVGKGVLKDEIYQYLSQFSRVKVGPADAKIYGMGASEIYIL